MAAWSIEELLKQLDAATAGHNAHACTQLYHPNAEAFTMFVIREGDERLIAGRYHPRILLQQGPDWRVVIQLQ